MLINQWNSVVRWELRTKLFLRTLEFFWQEGHTAHATFEEAEAETRQMLDIYTDFAAERSRRARDSRPKIRLRALRRRRATYSIEAMMGDGKALQAGTSHNLGQNFAKAFEIRYLDKNGVLQHCWTTSWGLSTRFIGAIIMVHGDDQGLILPPRLAPFQVVIVPIFKTDEEKALVMEAATRIRAELVEADIRVKVDEREGFSPGFKFNDWEMRGVPLRMEMGPKDVAKGSVVLARRDRPGKEGKTFVPQQGIAAAVARNAARHSEGALRPRAGFPRIAHPGARGLRRVQRPSKQGFARAHWCGNADCEEQNQGRDQGHAALHSAGATRQARQMYFLRPGFDGTGDFRQGLLSRHFSSTDKRSIRPQNASKLGSWIPRARRRACGIFAQSSEVFCGWRRLRAF